ncbi:hypothetical protein NNC19_18800 [Clostridium sp. SHJSY1]|uniref:hypothetical protein n=1 Tax=Clostridium sp. SHJSY1 TaxID=2942483 RepID=UPI0028767451|nr:hypothetical protein [Clostridium sp. SHJSY1]MDS0527743.1 hypothetical protein [Clostridium sp. SHJSY1]
MCSKKVVALLLVLGIGASTYALANQVNKKGLFGGTIEQNVVYAKSDATDVSENNSQLSRTEDEAIKEKSAEVLKKYFNITPSENSKFSSTVISENTLNDLKEKELKMIKEAYENKKISDEEFNKQTEDVEKNNSGLHETISKLKHGVIQTAWMDGDNCYLIFFNENTKEAEYVIAGDGESASETSLDLSEEEVKNTAEEFIKEYKLGDIEHPKCILVKGKHVYYQEENDPTKKVEVTVGKNSGKVYAFRTKAYADMDYAEEINEK